MPRAMSKCRPNQAAMSVGLQCLCSREASFITYGLILMKLSYCVPSFSVSVRRPSRSRLPLNRTTFPTTICLAP